MTGSIAKLIRYFAKLTPGTRATAIAKSSGHFTCDETAARSISEVLIDPAHVIEELPESLAPALRELELNDHVLPVSIDRQQVDTAGLNGKLDALVLRRSVKS